MVSCIVSGVAMVMPLWQNTVAEWSAVLSQRLPWLCLCDRTQWLNVQLYCLRGCHGCAFVTLHNGRMFSGIVSEVVMVVPLWQNTVAECSAVLSQRLPWLCLCDRTQWLNGQLYCLKGCHDCAFVTEHNGRMFSCIVSEVAMAVPLWHYTMAECSAVLSQRLPWLCLCDITQWQNVQRYCLRGCHGCAFVTEHSGWMFSCIVPDVAMVVPLWQNTMAEWSAVLSQRLSWLCLCDITQWQNVQQ